VIHNWKIRVIAKFIYLIFFIHIFAECLKPILVGKSAGKAYFPLLIFITNPYLTSVLNNSLSLEFSIFSLNNELITSLTSLKLPLFPSLDKAKIISAYLVGELEVFRKVVKSFDTSFAASFNVTFISIGWECLTA